MILLGNKQGTQNSWLDRAVQSREGNDELGLTKRVRADLVVFERQQYAVGHDTPVREVVYLGFGTAVKPIFVRDDVTLWQVLSRVIGKLLEVAGLENIFGSQRPRAFEIVVDRFGVIDRVHLARQHFFGSEPQTDELFACVVNVTPDVQAP